MEIPESKKDYRWDVYDSRINKVNGHVECKYTIQNGCWTEPEFIENPFIQVHGLAPGLHYGQQVYEGLLARRTSTNGVLIFRPASNAARMARSALAVSMPPVPQDVFLKAVHMAVAMNAEYVPPHNIPGSLYVRPFQFGSGCQIGLEPPDEFTFCVFVQPHIAFHGHGTLRALIAEDFDRAATRGTGHVKVGGNYAPVIRWSREARRPENGAWSVLLHLDSQTQTWLDEFSTSGFIGIIGPEEVAKGESITKVVIPESNAAIDSITSDSVATLARSFAWEVTKRPIKVSELHSFMEVMAVGTAAGIVPVTCIHRRSTGEIFNFTSGGPCFRKLRDELVGIQKGDMKDSFGWCERLRYAELGR